MEKHYSGNSKPRKETSSQSEEVKWKIREIGVEMNAIDSPNSKWIRFLFSPSSLLRKHAQDSHFKIFFINRLYFLESYFGFTEISTTGPTEKLKIIEEHKALHRYKVVFLWINIEVPETWLTHQKEMNQQNLSYLVFKEHQGLNGAAAGRIVYSAMANFSRDWWIAYLNSI